MSFAGIQQLNPTNDQFVSVAQYGTDKNLYVEFYEEMIHMEAKSKEAGHPIYESHTFIHMIYSGGKSDYKRAVKMEDDQWSPSDPHRFPRQWEAFKANQEQAQSGTPLELMPWLKKEQIFGLKAQHIATVEQLSALPDSALSMMGMREMRDRAKAYLETASGAHAQFDAIKAENENMKTDMEAMKAQLAQMSEMLMEKRRPGRPARKEVAHGTES